MSRYPPTPTHVDEVRLRTFELLELARQTDALANAMEASGVEVVPMSGTKGASAGMDNLRDWLNSGVENLLDWLGLKAGEEPSHRWLYDVVKSGKHRVTGQVDINWPTRTDMLAQRLKADQSAKERDARGQIKTGSLYPDGTIATHAQLDVWQWLHFKRQANLVKGTTVEQSCDALHEAANNGRPEKALALGFTAADLKEAVSRVEELTRQAQAASVFHAHPRRAIDLADDEPEGSMSRATPVVPTTRRAIDLSDEDDPNPKKAVFISSLTDDEKVTLENLVRVLSMDWYGDEEDAARVAATRIIKSGNTVALRNWNVSDAIAELFRHSVPAVDAAFSVKKRPLKLSAKRRTLRGLMDQWHAAAHSQHPALLEYVTKSLAVHREMDDVDPVELRAAMRELIETGDPAGLLALGYTLQDVVNCEEAWEKNPPPGFEKRSVARGGKAKKKR